MNQLFQFELEEMGRTRREFAWRKKLLGELCQVVALNICCEVGGKATSTVPDFGTVAIFPILLDDLPKADWDDPWFVEGDQDDKYEYYLCLVDEKDFFCNRAIGCGFPERGDLHVDLTKNTVLKRATFEEHLSFIWNLPTIAKGFGLEWEVIQKDLRSWVDWFNRKRSKEEIRKRVYE